MAHPDLTGLDPQYLDRWPAGCRWLMLVLTVGFCGIFFSDAIKHGLAWTASWWGLLAVVVTVEQVLRWRRPPGVRISTEGVSVRGGSSLLRPGRWHLHRWEEVVGVQVEDRRAFPSRLQVRSDPSVSLPGMAAQAAHELERVVEDHQGRVRLRRAE